MITLFMTSEQTYNLVALLVPAVLALGASWYYLYSAFRYRRHYGKPAAIILSSLVAASLLAAAVYLIRS